MLAASRWLLLDLRCVGHFPGADEGLFSCIRAGVTVSARRVAKALLILLHSWDLVLPPLCVQARTLWQSSVVGYLCECCTRDPDALTYAAPGYLARTYAGEL